jgi:hypothetical protein
MRSAWRRLAAGGAAVAALAIPHAVASATPTAPTATPATPITTARATALGRLAYLYGFPLLEFLRVQRTETSVRCPDHLGDAPLNTFSNARKFADPSDRTVVAPNVDTLYSIAHLDLGRGPIVLSHPDMGHRYFVFELVDPYTNVIGYIGSRTTGSRAGRFEIEWSGEPGHRIAGTRVIRTRYRRVWVIGRTLVSGGTEDRRRAVALMRRYRLSPPGGPRHFRPGCRPGRPTSATTPTGLPFLQALDRALRANPPPAHDRPLLRRLARVGVGPGLDPLHADLPSDVLDALVAGVNSTAASLETVARLEVLKEAEADHGWATIGPNIGAFGTDYSFRAVVAALGLGANTPAEAEYPTALTDSGGQPLTGASDYRLVFKRGQTPPNHAFWSLTMYDGSGFLVANPEHRYAIGDSHPPLRREPNGNVVILIQRTRPSQPHVNWLPSPSGNFRLNMRIYWPTRRVLDGRWQPPPVQLVSP